MAERRKLRIDRLIIFILACLIVLALLTFGMYQLFKLIFDRDAGNDKPEPISDPVPVSTNEDIKINLNDYEIYLDDTNNLGFNFIIANMTFKSDKAVSFDLKNLQTSEKIHLNDVSKYLNTLNEKGYRIDKLDYVTSVVSDEKEYTCNIFIPYTTGSYSLRLLNELDASMIEFVLNQNTKDITSLKFDTEQKIEVGDASVKVSSSSISTLMRHNDEDYQIPSTMNVYTFRIYVEESASKLVIVDANFVRDSDGEVIHCMDESYESEKIQNCLNKELVTGDNGALFFETAIQNNPDFSGFLMLKFSNSDDWVKIPTVLE
ncbi:MAG: hypothetical protein IKS51_04525 [Erysipelotrichaceae bacterium]|nr:hypothetical protein [Erysipelotrichaceae bacterium]